MSVEKRMYADAKQAKAAIDELFSKGFSDVKASFKPDRVRVAVNAPFGEGQSAAQILDSHGPLPADEEAWEDADLYLATPPDLGIMSRIRDPANPLSDLVGMRVLMDGLSPLSPKSLIDSAAPLSSWLGWTTLYELAGGARKPAAAAKPERASKERAEADAPTTALEARPAKDKRPRPAP